MNKFSDNGVKSTKPGPIEGGQMPIRGCLDNQVEFLAAEIRRLTRELTEAKEEIRLLKLERGSNALEVQER